MKKYISFISVGIFSIAILSPNLAQAITSYPGIYPDSYPTDYYSKTYPNNYNVAYPTDYYGTDHPANYNGSSTVLYSSANNYSSNANTQAVDAAKQALIQSLTKLLLELQKKLQDAIAQKNSALIQAQNQTRAITIYAGPFSQRGDNTFWGNDEIGISWSSNYKTISPSINLYNSAGINVFQKNLTPGAVSSSAKFGEQIGVNQNWQTGTYRIGVCDNQTTSQSICGYTNYFTITATTTPFKL